jgi:thiol:disulfide interchange protein DsbC
MHGVLRPPSNTGRAIAERAEVVQHRRTDAPLSHRDLAMQTQRVIRITAGLLIVALSLAASAAQDDKAAIAATIQETFEKRFSDQKVLHVVPAAIDGLYEIFTGTEVLYSDRTGDYLVNGSLIETRTKKNLTSGRVDELNRIEFATLPFDRAIKITHGNGKRQLAIFSDPDCPYCRRLEKELASLEDVTIYTFLFPLASIHPKAAAKSEAIWCAPDRAAAWLQWMVEGKEPESRTCESNPTSQLVELGKKLHITGTPTMYFSDGRRQTGGMRAKDLMDALDQALAESNATAAKHGGDSAQRRRG